MKGSIVQEYPAEGCYICGRGGYLEEHHIFGGANRKHSEKYGLKVRLCPECHRDNKKGVHGDAELNEKLKQIGQVCFEKKHCHERFMRIFGKNYMETENRPSAPHEEGFMLLEDEDGG